MVYSWSNIWAKNTATSSAAGLSFTFSPAHKHKHITSLCSFFTALSASRPCFCIYMLMKLRNSTTWKHKAQDLLKTHHAMPPTSAPLGGCQTNPWIFRGRYKGKDIDLHSSPLLSASLRQTNKHGHTEITDQTSPPSDPIVARLLNKAKTITVINQRSAQYVYCILETQYCARLSCVCVWANKIKMHAH